MDSERVVLQLRVFWECGKEISVEWGTGGEGEREREESCCCCKGFQGGE